MPFSGRRRKTENPQRLERKEERWAGGLEVYERETEMGTFVTGIIVLGIAGMAIWRILKKDGKSCGGDCCGCRMSDDSDQ
jgi:hypothetical protein